MGNAPGGTKRHPSTEDDTPNSSGRFSIPASVAAANQSSITSATGRKLFVQASQEDAIMKILSEANMDDVVSQMRATRLTDGISGGPAGKTLPTVFKWEGGGKEVFLSGTFNNWKTKIPMVKSKHNFYTIIDLPQGEHHYKFIVDGQWKVDTNQATSNASGAQNNVIEVKPSDFDVLEALSHDMANSKNQSSTTSVVIGGRDLDRRRGHSAASANGNDDPMAIGGSGCEPKPGSSPPGEYNRVVPQKSLLAELGSEKVPTPPLLPPQLLQVILNKDTGAHCDPNLLPQPNHVMVNHMYALSIKDGVIVLSAITRYRQKFVSTVMYKPI